MNYLEHYNRLCNRAKDRKISGYKERHHIIPRCLGGLDNTDNLVYLTAEEHYTAHLLLVKIYPNNAKLIFAATRMLSTSPTQGRKNKRYGWLRKKHAAACSANQSGRKNSQHGKKWFYNPETLESKSFFPDNAPPEWKLGRILNRENYRKKLNRQTKKQRCEETIKNAMLLYTSFIENGYSSISEFIRDGNWDKSHEALRLLWVKYVPEYKGLSSQGIPFLKSAGKVFTDTRESSKL